MTQPSLFPDGEAGRIVNVASVPQRSLFRYPGGKTWLVPRFRQWLRSFPVKPLELIEPFAGGGIIGLTAAFEELACHITMIERDEQVAAVWHTVLNGGGEWLAARIMEFTPSPESVKAEFAKSDLSVREIAFQTIVKNRVNHGGILASGSGMLKQGENGKGLASRWYPETLRKRISDIAQVKHRICFIEGDGLTVLRDNAHRTDAVFYIDPPYTAAGKKAGQRLYNYNQLDHERLFAIAASLRGDFLMTYDNAEGVKEMAQRYNFDTQAIPMKNTHHAEMTELLIGRNLHWLRHTEN